MLPSARLFSILLSLLALSLAPVVAQSGEPPGAGRDLVVVEGADYFGLDYETLKEVELDACKAACLDDARCKAFTYNTKARWCFLKSDFGELRAFPGAVSGYLATGAASKAGQEAARRSELAFLPRGTFDEARKVGEQILKRPSTVSGAYDALLADANAALAAGNPERAAELLAAALRLAPESTALWTQLAEASLASRPEDWRTQQRRRQEALAAAVRAQLHAETPAERARALALIGRALAERSAWRPAIRAQRASLALVDDPTVRASYDRLVAEHGFRVRQHRVDSDAANPRICLELSDPLPRERAGLADFVTVEGGTNLAVEVEPQQICVDGVEHGGRYRIGLRAGLPSADGETLAKPVEIEVYVRDRSPSVRFLGRAYVLPKGGEAAIPLVSVNTDRITAQVYRVGDRSLAATVSGGSFLKPLTPDESRTIGERTGEAVWSGTVEVSPTLNREVTTAVPVGALIDDFKPGAYVMTARPSETPEEEYEAVATQWFLVSDLGLSGFSGSDGLHALVRSLSTAAPIGEVGLRLVAKNDEVLGRAATDAAGYARLEAGLLRGRGGNAPALLVADGPDGDYAFLDLTKTPFDLSDRGVEGRPAPKPMDVYLVSERGIYRPGETVHLTALARDPAATAITGLPLTLIVKRPDGVEHLRALVGDQGLGGRDLAVSLPLAALRGTWRAAVHADPKGPALAELSFAVEDFLPERLAFDLQTSATALDPDDPPRIAVDARFLYGAPAANLALEGETLLKAADTLAEFPGYRFGLADEQVDPLREPLPPATTDAQGQAELRPQLPAIAPTSRPLTAEVNVRLVDAGRPVERSLTLPVASREARIGLRPLFEGSVDEGGSAGFEVIALGPDGRRVARQGLTWTLSRVTKTFQWYQMDGAWDYEPVVTRQRVASGTLNAGADDPGRIEARVDWGGYELEVSAPDGGMLPVSLAFEAGWYVTPGAVDTPDLLKVSLDKPSYRVGETARVRIEPRFAGQALVLVIDDRLITMTPAEVSAEGATVELPVTADWGAGAYVTAVLYRPMDLTAKRMPGRAIGLAWAGVDPGARKLDLRLALPEKAEPRRPLDIAVALGNLAAGEEAYVTLAAVDLGILNLTRYQPPAPDAWYFGQRRLGMELRDLYGALIDRMQGVPGVVRSGGDAGLMRFEGPPPTEALVAFYSGILRLDQQGGASASFELPDFNGTVRVMAMAWSAEGVGHAVQDLVVRDPVVISASLPRLLAPGDRSRLLIDLAHVEGPAGAITLEVAAEGEGLLLDPTGVPSTLRLAEGERAQVSVPIEARAIGDQRLAIRLRTPDGRELTKDLTLAVRERRPPTAQTSVTTLAPAAEQHLTADRLAGLVPGTGSLLVSVSGAGRIDVPGLVQALDLNPYGCAEQLTSRALPLLYLDEIALAAGLSGDRGVGERVREAIHGVLASQSSGGGFGLWGPDGGGDLWLDAYVTDFLTRAREQGYEIAQVPLELALDNLKNRSGYAADFESGGEDLAYALYVLARNGRALIGDLRYYAETKLEAFATPLAKAQIGAALALYGDRPRADTAFRAALAQLSAVPDAGGWRSDFGSGLRDAAALLALAAEAGSGAVDLQTLAGRIAEWREVQTHTSTQENAWLLLAAHALNQGAVRPRLSVDGVDQDGALYRRVDEASLAEGGMRLVNRGDRPVDLVVTATGVPLTPPPAGGNGYWIERAYYDLEGRRIDPSRVAQGERLVAVLTISADSRRAARLILSDPLPAGFEIDNPNLVRAGDVAGIPWLGLIEGTAHQAFLADRFVAAVDRGEDDDAQMQLAYVVRAVSPGVFAHPAATVEDMYRPERRAWTDEGRVEVMTPEP
jgi:hypothetical protein